VAGEDHRRLVELLSRGSAEEDDLVAAKLDPLALLALDSPVLVASSGRRTTTSSGWYQLLRGPAGSRPNARICPAM
jgi:hypothetical protein